MVDESCTTISSRVKTGLHSIRTIRLPIAENSVAGYVALTGRCSTSTTPTTSASSSPSPRMEFRREVDDRTGYRCHQMLVAPIASPDDGGARRHPAHQHPQWRGVLGDRRGGRRAGQTLAIAFAQRRHALIQLKSRYEGLINDGKLTRRAGAATSAARAGRCPRAVPDRKLQAQGGRHRQRPCRGFSACPTSPFRRERVKPLDLLKNLKRDYVQQAQWLPLEENPKGC